MPYSGLLDPPLVCDDLDTPTYAPEAILFDGSTDFMERGALTGIAAGKQGIFSAWLRLDSSGSLNVVFGGDIGGTPRFFAQILASDIFDITGRNAANAIILNFSSNTVLTSTYRHVLASWDLATLTVQLYIDDVPDLDAGIVAVDDDIPYDSIDRWNIGSVLSGGALYPGAMADFYFSDEFLDLTVAANRRKFIDASGNPVFLGNAGELPTGVSPTIYTRGNLADQGVNSGTGGDFVSQATQVPGETPGPVADGTNDPLAAQTTPHSWNGL